MTYQDNIAKAQQLIGSHPGTWTASTPNPSLA